MYTDILVPGSRAKVLQNSILLASFPCMWRNLRSAETRKERRRDFLPPSTNYVPWVAFTVRRDVGRC